ncbi:MAG: hypothetical protein V1778_01650 [bacterium]
MKSTRSPYTTPATIDDLARMIAEGFAQTATKNEMAEGFAQTASKKDLQKVETRLTTVEDRLTTVEAKLDRALYSEYTHLERRVTRLEKKTGIVE